MVLSMDIQYYRNWIPGSKMVPTWHISHEPFLALGFTSTLCGQLHMAY